MTENRTFEEAIGELVAESPELRQELEDSEPAFLVAREIIRARTELGISQAELAKRMGTTQSAVSRLERMDTTPTLETALKAARALGCSLQLRFVREGVLVDETHGAPSGALYGGGHIYTGLLKAAMAHADEEAPTFETLAEELGLESHEVMVQLNHFWMKLYQGAPPLIIKVAVPPDALLDRLSREVEAVDEGALDVEHISPEEHRRAPTN